MINFLVEDTWIRKSGTLCRPYVTLWSVWLHCWRCVPQSECADATVDNRWKSQLTGNFNRCVTITSISPASRWPVQLNVNVCTRWYTTQSRVISKLQI